MTQGTKSILIGSHSVIHSILVIKAWRIVYNKWPSLKIILCIFLHDIGYYGMNYITNKSNIGHAELGARIAKKIFGKEYYELIIGHSASSRNKYKIYDTRLEAPDDYSWLIAPKWWISFSNLIERHHVPMEIWIEAVRKNYYSNNKLSGTELYHSLRKGSYDNT